MEVETRNWDVLHTGTNCTKECKHSTLLTGTGESILSSVTTNLLLKINDERNDIMMQ